MPAQPENQIEFLWNVHSYTNEYIRFADTKAAVVIAWSAALLGALVAAKAQDCVLKCTSYVFAAIAVLALALLAAAFIAAVAVVIPRVSVGAEKGFIFWDGIRAHESTESYKADFCLLSQADLAGKQLEHLRVLADIANKKYFRTAWSIRLAFLGSIAATVLLLFKS